MREVPKPEAVLASAQWVLVFGRGRPCQRTGVCERTDTNLVTRTRFLRYLARQDPGLLAYLQGQNSGVFARGIVTTMHGDILRMSGQLRWQHDGGHV